MSDKARAVTLRATVVRRSDGEPVSFVDAQDPADLLRYETDEFTLVAGQRDPNDYKVNPASGRWNKRKKPREIPEQALRNQVRRRRDHLIDSSAWATGPESPLSEACQAEWRRYRRELHAITKGVTDFAAVRFPEPPAIEYAEEP